QNETFGPWRIRQRMGGLLCRQNGCNPALWYTKDIRERGRPMTASPTSAAAARDTGPAAKLYHRGEGVLRENILAERLPRGFVLLEGAIAGILQTSRAPVQRALRMLEAEGLVHRFDGRGYLAGPLDGNVRPLRRDIREFDLILPDAENGARAGWERIYAEIEM